MPFFSCQKTCDGVAYFAQSRPANSPTCKTVPDLIGFPETRQIKCPHGEGAVVYFFYGFAFAIAANSSQDVVWKAKCGSCGILFLNIYITMHHVSGNTTFHSEQNRFLDNIFFVVHLRFLALSSCNLVLWEGFAIIIKSKANFETTWSSCIANTNYILCAIFEYSHGFAVYIKDSRRAWLSRY